MKLSNLKIGTRLKMGFGLIVMLLAVVLVVVYVNFANLGRANDINVHTYQVLGEVSGLLESLINIETGERGFALTGNDASLEPYKSGKDAFKKHWDLAKSLTSDNPKQQERLQTLAQEQQAWIAVGIDAVIKLRREATDGKMDAVVAAEQAGAGKKGMDTMRRLLSEIDGAEESLLAIRAKDAAALQLTTNSVLIGGGILAAILSALLAFWLAANITRPLIKAIELAKLVAAGDLTVKVDVSSTDETGELLSALKVMNQSLISIVGEVRSGTETIATASTQIASGNLDLSSRTEEQASSLEETASSMEEMTSTVKQNAANAQQANSLAMAASEVAKKGGHVVAEVVATMGSINESSRKIVDIISVIDGIAFQTNILALNAAVEAARAGEQGRGFAVVASEVRNLAQRSAAAAKEIKSLIDSSVEKVDIGAKLVDQAGSTMEEIVDSVKRVTDIMGEITIASQEQTSGIEQINQTIAQMDEVTQQNAALVEEAAAAASSMQDQAANLSQVVSIFKIDSAARMPASSHAGTVQQKPRLVARQQTTSASPARSHRRDHALAAVPAKQNVTVGKGDDWEEF